MKTEATRYIYSLVNRMSKIARRQMSDDSEFGGDVSVFGLIFSAENQQKRVRMTDISRHLMVSKPAATQVVNRLTERGLVERIRDEADRRVVYIQATAAGLKLFEEKLNERLDSIDRAIDRIGLDKARQLGALLDEFVDALVSVSEV